MKFLQPSLSGGELSPGMRGRVDLARYSISLGKSRNFITKATGGGAKRPGTMLRGRVKFSDRFTRLIPFVYSTQVKYLIEAGDGYFRFWVGGALLTNHEVEVTDITAANPAVVTAAAHGFNDGDQVVINGVRGMTRVNGRTFTVAGVTTNTFQLQGWDAAGDQAYVGGGIVGRIVEVATPYTAGSVAEVRFTQSADVLYMVHGQFRPQELRRLAATVFEMRDFAYRRGPFREINGDEAVVMAVSGTQGTITITTNVDTFNADKVGALLYLEEKELQGVKPWASAEKNVPLNAQRRSDSKVFRCAEVPSLAGLTSSDSSQPPYYVCGGVRPVHDVGRAWDGPADTKFDGVAQYKVGVNWEFLHNTFGIVQITEFIDAKTVKALVIERLPDSLIGTAPSPASSWTFSGDGTTTEFSITGASSLSQLDYRVEINGTPIQSNPNYGGGGGGDRCAWTMCWVIEESLGRIRAGDVVVGQSLRGADGVYRKVVHSSRVVRYGMRVTAGFATFTGSATAELLLADGTFCQASVIAGRQVNTYDADYMPMAATASAEPVGSIEVQQITLEGERWEDRAFLVGDGAWLVGHHNIKRETGGEL